MPYRIILLIALIAVLSQKGFSQKAGYVSIDDVVSIMPETAKLDAVLKQFQKDSIGAAYKSTYEEFRYKDSMMGKTDTSKMPLSMRNQYRQDLQILYNNLNNWQSIAQQAIENKRNRFLQPLYRKAFATVQTVAKENGFTYVYSKDAVLVAPPNYDLLPLVAKKLGITMPQNQQGTGTKPNQ